MILLFPNLTAHALAEPEYLPYCESLMAFCRENGIPCYNFQYVKADYMENLDAYYYDLYHLNGEGADKFSAFFARFFNAYVGGDGRGRLVYADSAEYLASVDRVTNAWLMRRGEPVCRGLQSGHAGHAAVSLLPLHGRRADPSARLQRG